MYSCTAKLHTESKVKTWGFWAVNLGRLHNQDILQHWEELVMSVPTGNKSCFCLAVRTSPFWGTPLPPPYNPFVRLKELPWVNHTMCWSNPDSTAIKEKFTFLFLSPFLNVYQPLTLTTSKRPIHLPKLKTNITFKWRHLTESLYICDHILL